jgi:hypothetical protein
MVSIATFLFLLLLPLGAQAAGNPQLVSSPSNLRFGTVPVGQSEAQLVTLTNTGRTSVTVKAVSASSSAFSVSALSLPVAVGVGQSVTLKLNFTPTQTGWTGGMVTVASNSSNPRLQLTTGGVGVKSDPLAAIPSSLSFGSVAVGGRTQSQIVLTNARPWKETINAFQTVGTSFSVSGPSLPIVLVAGESATLNVFFAPQAAGMTGGSLFISGPGLNIPLSGTGTATTVRNLTIAPSAIQFGNVNVGNNNVQHSSLTASGGNVTVSSASSSNSQFSLSGISLPLTISAGQTVAFDVEFSPTQSGAFKSSLTFASNAASSPTESLTGTGVTPQHTVNLSWDASTSSVAGYNVYRGASAGAYTKINRTMDANTAYADTTVLSGTTYYYAATAVNSSGQESAYSTPIKVSVP